MRKLIFILFLFPLAIFAQEASASAEREARKYVREGNELYNNLKFSDAEIAYRKAISKNPNYEAAHYNLGNALFHQNRSKEAVAEYELIAKTAKQKDAVAKTLHNMGNALYAEKDYQRAVDAYKQALRFNPKDDETRYNYALAKEKLEEQQNQDDKDQDDKDKDKENKEDKKDQDKKEGEDQKDEEKQQDENGDDKSDENQNEQDQKKPENKEGNNDKPQPPREGQLSPQQVEQLLEAMNNEEKKTQDKVNAQQVQGKKINQEKDW